MNGDTADWRPVTGGMPHGSILGPVIFAVYDSDLPDGLALDAYLFADDTRVFQRYYSTRGSGATYPISLVDGHTHGSQKLHPGSKIYCKGCWL